MILMMRIMTVYKIGEVAAAEFTGDHLTAFPHC